MIHRLARRLAAGATVATIAAAALTVALGLARPTPPAHDQHVHAECTQQRPGADQRETVLAGRRCLPQTRARYSIQKAPVQEASDIL
jgi:hypothetical protein